MLHDVDIGPRGIKVKQQRPCVKLACNGMIHIAQGGNMATILANFLDRQGLKPPRNGPDGFFSTYDILTCVKKGDDFRALVDPQDLHYLDVLMPSIELLEAG
jgi:hypothetical protein